MTFYKHFAANQTSKWDSNMDFTVENMFSKRTIHKMYEYGKIIFISFQYS